MYIILHLCLYVSIYPTISLYIYTRHNRQRLKNFSNDLPKKNLFACRQQIFSKIIYKCLTICCTHTQIDRDSCVCVGAHKISKMAAKEIRQFAWKIEGGAKVSRAVRKNRAGKKQIATNLFITKGTTTTTTTKAVAI